MKRWPVLFIVRLRGDLPNEGHGGVLETSWSQADYVWTALQYACVLALSWRGLCYLGHSYSDSNQGLIR
jgi:hypothetical protein